MIEALIAEVEELRAECAEHRAARGIEAPAGWQRSAEALWERAASDRREVDEEGVPYPNECPDGWLVVEEWHEPQPDGAWRWAWYVGGGAVRADGAAATCLGAIAAAEAALADREGT